MTPLFRRPATRWAAPLVVVAALVGAANLAPPFAAGPTPKRPPLPAEQLVPKVPNASAPALPGTTRSPASLGLPNLGSLRVGDTPLTELLSGTHEARIWEDGPDRVRVALIDAL